MRKKYLVSLLSLPLRNSYVFVFCVLFIFLQAGFHTGRRDKLKAETLLVTPELQDEWLAKSSNILPFGGSRSQSVIDEHPIPKLMENGEERYRRKVYAQSKTLKAAVAEYKRRYKRPPPKGFNEWWKFAKRHDAKMVDEYDGMMEDLAPFWNLSGVELRRRAAQAGELPFVDLVRLRKGVSTSVNLRNDGVGGRAEGFRSMLSRFENTLPDMDFPINTQSESRVLVPWEHRVYPNLTVQDSSNGINAMLGGHFQPDWANDGNTWEAWRRTCHPDSAARRIFSSLRNSFRVEATNYLDPSLSPGDDFFFSSNTSAHLNFCNKPYAHYFQGHFFSDWRSIPALYPIFSPAKATGFLDIRIPSHYYFGNTPRYTYGWDSINLEVKEVDAMEVPWEEKIDKVFWRGATTGGGNHPPGFSPQFHRQRFLHMASDQSEMNRTVTFADHSTSTNFVAATVPVAKLNEEVMDTAFVKAVSADSFPGGLEGMKAQHRFADSTPLGRHWTYRYLVDLDGVGYSGRFMAFLASDSVPVKATIYREYFSDWIEPWVHFIPLSSNYQELYNIHAYFSGPTKSALESLGSSEANIPLESRRSVEGDKRLRRIARAGKQWKKTNGRHVDMEVYVYRLCLEWARLVSDDRHSMNYR